VTAIGSQDNDKKDPRPYALVEVAEYAVRGLLDTGASLSVLGKGCSELVNKLNISWRPIHAKVRTATACPRTVDMDLLIGTRTLPGNRLLKKFRRSNKNFWTRRNLNRS